MFRVPIGPRLTPNEKAWFSGRRKQLGRSVHPVSGILFQVLWFRVHGAGFRARYWGGGLGHPQFDSNCAGFFF